MTPSGVGKDQEMKCLYPVWLGWMNTYWMMWPVGVFLKIGFGIVRQNRRRKK